MTIQFQWPRVVDKDESNSKPQSKKSFKNIKESKKSQIHLKKYTSYSPIRIQLKTPESLTSTHPDPFDSPLTQFQPSISSPHHFFFMDSSLSPPESKSLSNSVNSTFLISKPQKSRHKKLLAQIKKPRHKSKGKSVIKKLNK